MRIPRDDLRVPDAQADLYLVGLGIGGFDSRSVEVDALLRDATAVLHLTAFGPELDMICSGSVEDLSGEYFEGTSPELIYAAMTRRVSAVAGGLRGLGYVCFVTYGHPLLLVDTSWQLLREPLLRVKAIAATSFLDQILCDLDYRFDAAVQVYEANVFLKRKPVVDTSVPLVLAQVGEVSSETISLRLRKHDWVKPLFDEIADLYPPERQCDLVFSAYRSDMEPRVSSASVDRLDTLISSVHPGCTLVVQGS